MPRGELAIVLHTHMPYVEGYGTWPFGEEWLWEAIATSYVPLLRVLDELGPQRSRESLTLSLTPVLCDQLEAPGAIERCIAFLRTVRPATHGLDIEGFERTGETAAVTELERSAAEYADAADTLERLADAGQGLTQSLGRHATWTSAATHAILPLLCLEESIELQLRVGIESHRRRFGAEWGGGFWMPECAHAPWLNPQLSASGVDASCVELTRLLGRGHELNLRPRKPDDGPLLIPIDREIIDLVWGAGGYPSRPAYRDRHHRTLHDHHVWANDGSIYAAERARQQAGQDAREFVGAVVGRLAGGGLCVCALDTELLGHWWHEGPLWLAAVLAEAERAGLTLTSLDPEALSRHAPIRADGHDDGHLQATTWGAAGDLRTWSAPAVADLAWQVRTAELRAHLRGTSPPPRAQRELLALQASDWAFLAYHDWAGDYPRQRASGHAAQLARALRGEIEEPHVRNLAPFLDYS